MSAYRPSGDIPIRYRRTKPRRFGLPGIAAALLMLGLGAVVQARAQDVPAMATQFGEKTYRLFCVGCHAPDGRGNVAVLEALQLPVVDLTTIAARNGGAFPAEAAKSAVLGTGTEGHARLEMAPWAEVFAGEFESFKAQAVINQMVDRRVDHLVAYIEALQRP